MLVPRLARPLVMPALPWATVARKAQAALDAASSPRPSGLSRLPASRISTAASVATSRETRSPSADVAYNARINAESCCYLKISMFSSCLFLSLMSTILFRLFYFGLKSPRSSHELCCFAQSWVRLMAGLVPFMAISCYPLLSIGLA